MFTLFFSVLVGGFALGMALYGEPFDLWEDPFSELGATLTPNGYENNAAMIVFVGDMIICGILLIIIAAAFGKDSRVPNRGVRVIFASAAAFGAFVATFPHNLFDLQHKLGSGFLVGSVWVLAIAFLVDASKRGSHKYVVFLHCILHGTVLAYAFAFFVDADSKQLFQKLAIAGLSLVIELGLAVLCRVPKVAVGEATVE